MKLKLIAATISLAFPLTSIADSYHHGHRHQNWVAPAIIGGLVAGAVIYNGTQTIEREVIVEDNYNWRYQQRQIERERAEQQRRYNQQRADNIRHRKIEQLERGDNYYHNQIPCCRYYDEYTDEYYYRDCY